jgi:hypothetical protein
MDADSKEFEDTLFQRVNRDLMKVIGTFFANGLQTLFVPCMTHGNLRRNKHYVDRAVNQGLKYILNDDEWFDFYEQNGIRIKVYGNINLLEDLGFGHALDWITDVTDRTVKNTNHTLYFGVGCSNREEYERLVDHAIDFQKEHGRKPTREEQVEWYYNGHVDDVDFFIRPTILRDSDVQPPLISGVKTQLYFPIAPFPFLDEQNIRQIYYDLLFQRTITFGNDTENLNRLKLEQHELIRQYYENNKSVIIGTGERIGDYWLPVNNLKVPKKLNDIE